MSFSQLSRKNIQNLAKGINHTELWMKIGKDKNGSMQKTHFLSRSERKKNWKPIFRL